jgi:hypothetical protein
LLLNILLSWVYHLATRRTAGLFFEVQNFFHGCSVSC